MQVNKTHAGLYTVTYGYRKSPLDVQEAAFAANGLGMISPAELGFLRAQEGGDTFKPYSRTNADVFYDDRTNQVVIVPDGAISKLVGIANLVDAHRQDREYVIPKNQRDLVYAMVDGMLNNGIAFIAPDGHTEVQTSKFGINDLTSRMFSDKGLGIEAQVYGDYLKSQGRTVNHFFMDETKYSQAQKVPYLSRVRVFGPDGVFGVDGGSRSLGLNGGAFGVRFEKTAEGGPKK